MPNLICIKCPQAIFLDPKKEICYKTGGLFCKRLKIIVDKYGPCRIIDKGAKKTAPKKKSKKPSP